MMNTSQLFGCEQKDKGLLTPYANVFWPSVLRCSHEAKLVMAWHGFDISMSEDGHRDVCHTR